MRKIIIILILVLSVRTIYSQESAIRMGKGLSLLETIAYSTIRLEVETKEGIFSGTSFCYDLFRKDSATFPILVTNKHVVRNSIIGKFYVNLQNEDGTLYIGETEKFELPDFEKRWFFHPDSNVDLAVMPFAPILKYSKEQGKEIFYTSLDERLIPDSSEIEIFDAIEKIIMIGYPNGIWDQYNNYPIIRSGITATHIKLNYNGRAEFMIDAASFPGSSGSPVFIFDSGVMYMRNNSEPMIGQKLFFVGILYGGPQYTVIGDVKIMSIRDKLTPKSISFIPNNLGNVIKSNKLEDFKKLFSAIWERRQ